MRTGNPDEVEMGCSPSKRVGEEGWREAVGGDSFTEPKDV